MGSRLRGRPGSALSKLSAIGAVLALAAATAGCGGKATSATPPSQSPAAPASGSTAALDRLDSVASHQRQYVIHDAEQQLVRSCMQRAGFEFVATPSSVMAALERANQLRKREPWDSPTAAEAARDGYGYLEARSSPPSDPEAANRQVLSRLSTAEQKRWNEALSSSAAGDQITVQVPLGFTASIPGRGCVADAWRTLYGQNLRRWQLVSTIVANLRSVATSRTIADEGYLRAVRAWSKCMSDRGFRLSDPGSTYGVVNGYYSGSSLDEAHAREIALAKADARCADASHLREVGGRIFAAYARSVTDQYQSDLLANDELDARAEAKAREILRR